MQQNRTPQDVTKTSKAAIAFYILTIIEGVAEVEAAGDAFNVENEWWTLLLEPRPLCFW